jgi:hypothetical protein
MQRRQRPLHALQLLEAEGGDVTVNWRAGAIPPRREAEAIAHPLAELGVNEDPEADADEQSDEGGNRPTTDHWTPPREAHREWQR